ncbi:MAG: HlyD family efflux transporter periplasmic adaptor subunit [Gemmatimonadota bacterium]
MLAVLGLVLAALLLPISIPVSLNAAARILPAREWLVLGSTTSGRFTVVLRDNATGQAEDLAAHELERGDDVRTELRAGLAAGTWVAAGDTVGRLRSPALEARLAELQTRLATAEAQLQLQAGSHRAIRIAGARRELAASQQQTRQQQKRVEGLRAFREAGRASKGQVEEAENMLALAAIGEEVARTELDAALVGATASDTGLSAAQIQDLQRERDLLQQRRAAQTLVAPFRGRVVAKAAGDTLLAVQGADSLIAQLWVPAQDQARVARGAAVTLRLPGRGKAVTGEIVRIGARRTPPGQQQVVLAWARLRPAEGVAPGLVGRATIRGKGVRLRQYVVELLAR